MSRKNASMDCMYGRNNDSLAKNSEQLMFWIRTDPRIRTYWSADPYRSISQVQIITDLDLGCGVSHLGCGVVHDGAAWLIGCGLAYRVRGSSQGAA